MCWAGLRAGTEHSGSLYLDFWFNKKLDGPSYGCCKYTRVEGMVLSVLYGQGGLRMLDCVQAWSVHRHNYSNASVPRGTIMHFHTDDHES